MMEDIRFIREWKIRKNYRDKYYFYSMTLDSLVRNCRLVRADSISLGFLIEDFKKNATYSLWETPIPQLQIWLGEMVMLGLIEMREKEDGIIMLSLSEDGFRAYQEQRFHSISASLFEAKISRELAVIAIVISFVSLVIAIIVAV